MTEWIFILYFFVPAMSYPNIAALTYSFESRADCRTEREALIKVESGGVAEAGGGYIATDCEPS